MIQLMAGADLVGKMKYPIYMHSSFSRPNDKVTKVSSWRGSMPNDKTGTV